MHVSGISSRFGQLFVGEMGKVIVLEPKELTGKDIILHQLTPNGAIHSLGALSIVDQWTRIAESYGPMFSKGSDGFYNLVSLLKRDLLQTGIIKLLPPSERYNAFYTLYAGKPSPFNGGIKLDYPA